MKYIIITGSVMSGIGKGTVASSIGVVLQSYGLRVTAIKIDPYLNPDSGTMSPFEHGETYVLNDGGETDLDLGNYERFLNIDLTRDHNITTGKIYLKVIEAERAGKYLGETVQIVPHITDAIQDWIETTAQVCVDDSRNVPQVCLIELGGTIGDLESAAYAEALRQFRYRLGEKNVLIVNVCYVPVLSTTQETKTKPAQAGIRESRRFGISPDLLVVRCSRELSSDSLTKLSDMCQIPIEKIFMNQDLESIYRVPLHFQENKLFFAIDAKLDLMGLVPELDAVKVRAFWKKWETMTEQLENGIPKKVAIVGKYTNMIDSYLTLTHAMKHAAAMVGIKPEIIWVESEKLYKEDGEDDELEKLLKVDAVLIPGGFGQRGIEGMILAANYARMKGIPCLGVCLGFQIMVIEYARNVLGLEDANSAEFDPMTPHPVLKIMDEDQKIMGGTMRLGLQKVMIQPGSLASEIYHGAKSCLDRHRHRYEVNPDYLEVEEFRQLFSGTDESGERMEIFEWNRNYSEKPFYSTKKHPFYLGTQFHGEYLTRPQKPHPVFVAWMKSTFF